MYMYIVRTHVIAYSTLPSTCRYNTMKVLTRDIGEFLDHLVQ